MKLTKQEKKLLRQQAEALAFIYNLRQYAISLGDRAYILMTKGIDEVIQRRRDTYPKVFQRYFTVALKNNEQREENNGEGKEIEGWKEAAGEHKKEKA